MCECGRGNSINVRFEIDTKEILPGIGYISTLNTEKRLKQHMARCFCRTILQTESRLVLLSSVDSIISLDFEWQVSASCHRTI